MFQKAVYSSQQNRDPISDSHQNGQQQVLPLIFDKGCELSTKEIIFIDYMSGITRTT